MPLITTPKRASMTASAAPRPRAARGRPSAERAAELSERIRNAAQQLMAERGFAAVSLDTIASAAGVTKRTIYARYASKLDLLKDVLRTLLNEITSSLKQSGQHGDARQCLQRLALHLLNHLLDEKCITWMRLATSELIQHAEFRDVLRALVEDGINFVAEALDSLSERGLFSVHDNRLAARFFVSLVHEPVMHWAYLGIPAPSKAAQKRYADEVVTFFLAGSANRGV